MHFIAITYPKILQNESEIINSLFHEGLPCLHLRKPGMHTNNVGLLLKKIECKFHDRVMVNDHIELANRYNIKGVHFSGQTQNMLPVPVNGLSKSCSCHSFNEISDVAPYCDYVFLSPVFNSISKSGYQSAFDFNELKIQLSKPHPTSIVALGGISPNKILQTSETGFDGAAVLGGLWNEKSKLDEVLSNFKTYKQQLKQCGLL
ncbi:MAG: thiamine phosphate synthase [Prolixibacteraceae bacterium]|nr:thiamine phosphate synthase [Prolixibacteraceae bacterium]